jgi:hypothetical protein
VELSRRLPQRGEPDANGRFLADPITHWRGREGRVWVESSPPGPSARDAAQAFRGARGCGSVSDQSDRVRLCKSSSGIPPQCQTNTAHIQPRRNPEDIDLAAIKTDLEFLMEQVAGLPTRKESAFKPLYVMIGSAGLVIAWFEIFWRHCL